MGILPTQKTAPETDLSAFTILIQGKPKAGKTEFASYFPGAIFLATEAGHKCLSVYKKDIDSWATFLEACKELAEGKHPFKTIVIDTVGNLYELCRQHVCQKLGVDHEADVGHGKAYSKIMSEFSRVLTRLSQLPYGLICIAHSEIEEIQTRTGTLRRTVPALRSKPRQYLSGMCDLILYFDMQDGVAADGTVTTKRLIHTKPHPTYEAGDRTGRLPETLETKYEVFMSAWNGAIQETLPATTPKPPATKPSAKAG